MDDTPIKAASEDQEVYEDIQNVTFEKNLYEQASTLATLSTFPMILSFLQSAATTLFSPETQERLRAELEVDKYFETLGEESLKREEETWASLKRIKSHTSVLFYIFNATEETFKLDYSSWNNDKLPAQDYEIKPLQYTSFILRSDIPQRIPHRQIHVSSKVNHGFTYRSEKFAFDFSSQLYLRHSLGESTPYVDHQINSIGKSSLACTSSLSRCMRESPFSYGVQIILGETA